MSDDERSSFDKLPKVLVFDGDAESYLDADEAYQRWARWHNSCGLTGDNIGCKGLSGFDIDGDSALARFGR